MPNLPANLPTDWELNMIISPNGTEAGLGEEYGYNYLMEQVNAAQQAINEAGGFIEAEEPPEARTANTLYGLILADYTGGGN